MVLQDPGEVGGIASCIFTISGWEGSLSGEVNPCWSTRMWRDAQCYPPRIQGEWLKIILQFDGRC